MENMVMVLIMVMASIVLNPFVSAGEVKPVKPVNVVADQVANADESDVTAEETDEDAIVMAVDETESD